MTSSLIRVKNAANKPEVVFGLYNFWLIFYPSDSVRILDGGGVLLRICKKAFTLFS